MISRYAATDGKRMEGGKSVNQISAVAKAEWQKKYWIVKQQDTSFGCQILFSQNIQNYWIQENADAKVINGKN